MPTREQAGVYVGTLHFLKAAKSAKSNDAAIVNADPPCTFAVCQDLTSCLGGARQQRPH
jgi:hypothetical protein